MNTFKGSLAVNIAVTLDFDLTSVVSVIYLVTKPDKTVVSWTATVDTAATGITHYTTIAGDLDTVGVYVLQPKATFASQAYYGEPISFDVNEVIVP